MKISLHIVFLSAFSLCSGSYYSQPASQPLGTQVTPSGPDVELPAIVGSKFSAAYPNIRPAWSKREEHYVAEFTDLSTHQKTSVMFDQFGNPLLTDRAVMAKKLPKKIRTYLAETYPDSTITVWQRYRDQKSMYYYSVNKNDTIHFNEQGAVIPHK